ncbi:MAG TPA: hypothetical protein VGO30_16320 [Mycobacterium sp.]|nr:hypothetical protein [Mycobacterium sp.]
MTGWPSGVGRAVVELLGAAGHDAVAWDLDGGDIDCDISDPEVVAVAMRTTIAERGTPPGHSTCT